MIEAAPIGWWNTGMPLVVLGALAVLLPRLLVSRATRSHRAVVVAIVGSAALLVMIGAVVFAAIYAFDGAEVLAAFQAAPGLTAWFFAKLATFAAIVWGPVLALVWFGMAQGVETRKGQDAAFLGR